MKSFILLVLATLCVVIVIQKIPDPSQLKIESTFRVNGKETTTIQAGAPTELTFQYRRSDQDGPVKEYEYEHEKLMHLVVVSEDLELYSHIHPVLDPATGTFKITVNQPIADPDSQDATVAMAKGGPYMLFTEIRPKGLPFIAAHRFSVTATGPGTQTAPVPDPLAPNGLIYKYFRTDHKPGQERDPYKVSLRSWKTKEGPDDVRYFEFWIKYNPPLPEGTFAPPHYDDVTDLEPWLSMHGHAILLSAGGGTIQDRQFRHMHSGMGGQAVRTGDMSAGSAGSHSAQSAPGKPAIQPPVGPTMVFGLFGHEIPPPGVYKLWGQFKHKGVILTFPFVVTL